MKISILQITKDCNQDCVYCCRDRSVKDKSLEDIKKEILSLSCGVEQIIITGGEPSLKKDLPDVIRFAKNKIPKVHLQSNGIFLHDLEYCKKIVQSGVDSVLIALPSIDKELCEKIAQTKGIFEKKILAIRNLSRFKNIDVGVVFVVNKKNHKEFPEYVKFISRISRDIYVQITYMIRFTDDLKKMKSLAARYSDFRPYLDEGLRICKEKNMQFRIDGFPLCFVQDYLDNVSDLITRKYNFVEDFIGSERKEYDSEHYVGKEHVKAEECSHCKLNSVCKGVYEYYSKVYGISELIRVKDIKTFK